MSSSSFGDVVPSTPILSVSRPVDTWRAGAKSRAPILSACVRNAVLYAFTADARLYRWNAAQGARAEEIDIGRDSLTFSAQFRPFLTADASGAHAFLSGFGGDNFYLSARAPRARRLTSWQGVHVTALAFDQDTCTEHGVSVLVASSRGALYSGSVQSGAADRDASATLESVHTLDSISTPKVTSVFLERLLADDGSVSLFVLLSTANPTRLYHFVGSGPLSALFQSYRSAHRSNFVELAGGSASGVVYRRAVGAEPRKFAMITTHGIYHGAVLLSSSAALLEAQMLEYSGTAEALEMSEHHFVCLKRDKVELVDRESGAVREELRLQAGAHAQRGLSIEKDDDGGKGHLWMVTDANVYQLHLLIEDRDAWRVHVARADAVSADRPSDRVPHLQRALQLCRGASQRGKLYAELGHVYLRARNWDAAASMFTKGSVGFETVCMLFLDEYNNGEDLQVYQGLCKYVYAKLDALEAESKVPQAVLSAWLADLYLHIISTIGKDGDADTVRNLFRTLLLEHRPAIHPSLMYHLLEAYGQRDMYLYFSELQEDYKNLIVDAMDNRDFKRALRILSRVSQAAADGLTADLSTVEKYMYIVTPTLLEYEPELTLELWKKNGNLDVGKLLPALLQFLNPSRKSDNKTFSRDEKLNLAVDCLESFLLKSLRKSSSKEHSGFGFGSTVGVRDESGNMLMNDSLQMTPAPLLKYLLVLYIMQGSELKILSMLKALFQEKKRKLESCAQVALELLEEGPDSVGVGEELSAEVAKSTKNFALDWRYLLSLCSETAQITGGSLALTQTIILAITQQFEQSMRLAIRQDRTLGLARSVAEVPDEPAVRRALWRELVVHIIQRANNVGRALQLVDDTEFLSIEDLLPHLPDFSKIDDFKTEICASLSSYKERIEATRHDISEFSDAAEWSKSSAAQLGDPAHSRLRISQAVECSVCKKSLFQEECYVFSCGHAFHVSCIADTVLPLLDASHQQRYTEIDRKLKEDASKTSWTEREEEEANNLRERLKGIIAADCPLCGYMAIDLVDAPLIEDADWTKAVRLW